jgi:hypothetical protein
MRVSVERAERGIRKRPIEEEEDNNEEKDDEKEEDDELKRGNGRPGKMRSFADEQWYFRAFFPSFKGSKSRKALRAKNEKHGYL